MLKCRLFPLIDMIQVRQSGGLSTGMPDTERHVALERTSTEKSTEDKKLPALLNNQKSPVMQFAPFALIMYLPIRGDLNSHKCQGKLYISRSVALLTNSTSLTLTLLLTIHYLTCSKCNSTTYFHICVDLNTKKYAQSVILQLRYDYATEGHFVSLQPRFRLHPRLSKFTRSRGIRALDSQLRLAGTCLFIFVA